MYRERLSVPWWWWLAAAALVAMMASEIFLGAPGVLTYLPYAVLVPAVLFGLWWLGRIDVVVDAETLRVDDARLPREFIAEVVPLDADARRDLLGPHAERLAFVVQRPWIGGAVQVVLDDPADPTPYWVISSRRPQALAAALGASADPSGSLPRGAGSPAG